MAHDTHAPTTTNLFGVCRFCDRFGLDLLRCWECGRAFHLHCLVESSGRCDACDQKAGQAKEAAG